MLLSSYDELCVCELTQAMGVSQPHVSRHLAQLRELGLVVDRRAGLWIYYRINPSLPSWALAALAETANGIRELPPFAQDAESLTRVPNRPGLARCG